jgi:hypothetical protein
MLLVYKKMAFWWHARDTISVCANKLMAVAEMIRFKFSVERKGHILLSRDTGSSKNSLPVKNFLNKQRIKIKLKHCLRWKKILCDSFTVLQHKIFIKIRRFL